MLPSSTTTTAKATTNCSCPWIFFSPTVNKLSPAEFRKQIAAVDAASGWPTFVISNHDIVRSYDRYGDGEHNDQIAKLMAALYLTLRGTPIMYYGEEIGMKTTPPTRKEDVKDPIGRTGWPEEKGRDGERTPMQWDGSDNAGFSTGTPWLPVPPTYKTHNVAADSRRIQIRSWSFIRTCSSCGTRIRRCWMETTRHSMRVMRTCCPTCASIRDQVVLVALNMSGPPQKVNFELKRNGFSSAKSLVATGKSKAKGDEVSLDPFGVFIAELSR